MKKTNKRKGFTIVELVIVIAVIAILSAILIPTFSNVVDQAKEAAAKQEISNTNTQMAIAYASAGKAMPTTLTYQIGDKYYEYKNGVVTATTTAPAGTSYTVVNGINVYNDTNATVGADAKTAIGNVNSYYTDNNNQYQYKLVAIKFDSEITANQSASLVIKDSMGKVVYNQSKTDSAQNKGSFYFSAYFLAQDKRAKMTPKQLIMAMQ